MLIDDYGRYLKGRGISQGTIGTYSRKLQIFLDSGYSEADLIGAVDRLIGAYSKGGCEYDPNDSGNTLAALNRLKDYVLEPYVKKLFISYKRGFQSFAPKKPYVAEYTITNGTITITYNKEHGFYKSVVKKISRVRYNRLIDLLLEYRGYLSKSGTVIVGHHGPISAYKYQLDAKSCADNCASLFEGRDNDPRYIKAVDEYKAWLKQFISEF